jgi:hypothetical protein
MMGSAAPFASGGGGSGSAVPAASSGTAEYGALPAYQTGTAPMNGPSVSAMTQVDNGLRTAGEWIGNNKLMVGTGLLGAGTLAYNNADDDDKERDARTEWTGKAPAWANDSSSSGGSSSGTGSVFSGSVSRYIEDSENNPYARGSIVPGSWLGRRR